MHLKTRITGPVAVIGDVHGQVEKLLSVLDKLRALPDYEQRWIVFIGDLVDRGPDPKGAVDVFFDLLMEHRRTTLICGNHEFAMCAALGWLRTPEFSNWNDRWLAHYEAEPTFESYGVEFGDLPALADRVPDNHRELLANLPWCVEHPNYLFVHAGLDPNTPFDVQLRILQKRDFTLNRPQWLCSKELVDAAPPPDCRLTVVSGHVRVPRVQFKSHRILLDTTGGMDGSLSCVLLPEKQVITSHADAASPRTRSWWQIWK